MAQNQNRLTELYQNIENDRNILEEAAKELKGQIKDLQSHVQAGQTLARYIDILSKINEQLLDIEKLRIKNENKEKVNEKNESEKIRKEIVDDDIIGTTLNRN